MISLVKYLFWFSAVAATGSSELVRTQRIVSAVLGEDVSFCCELTQPKDVLQVTWQKLTAHKPENIATYNKRSGARIINSLSGRLGFLQTGLQKCSVAIKGVTKKDETCYSCLFNSFPEGAIAGKTCLSVYEIYEPRFEVRTLEADAGEILSLTCSATGAPAPEISWNIKEEDILENSEEYSVTNPNGTITVTRNATVDISRLSGTEILINCTVRHPGWENKMELSQLIRTGKSLMMTQNDSVTTQRVSVACVIVGFFLVVIICGTGILIHRKITSGESSMKSPKGKDFEAPSISPRKGTPYKSFFEDSVLLNSQSAAPSSQGKISVNLSSLRKGTPFKEKICFENQSLLNEELKDPSSPRKESFTPSSPSSVRKRTPFKNIMLSKSPSGKKTNSKRSPSGKKASSKRLDFLKEETPLNI
ncbi:OX-2 membrane glycoprotein-like isoform X2 [Lepisosteus oculatus]|uniref:OX-2 membrane glycoprotein-like isoform X2 n=1 Tax=Lepisosteus oculatus TaxID=7918 RepID=UPI0035F5244C